MRLPGSSYEQPPAIREQFEATCVAGDADRRHTASFWGPLKSAGPDTALCCSGDHSHLGHWIMGEEEQLNVTTMYSLKPSGIALHTKQIH